MNIITTLAYLDPGTGAMILQAVIGSVLGGIYIAKLYWHKILSFCTGQKDSAEASNDD